MNLISNIAAHLTILITVQCNIWQLQGLDSFNKIVSHVCAMRVVAEPTISLKVKEDVSIWPGLSIFNKLQE